MLESRRDDSPRRRRSPRSALELFARYGGAPATRPRRPRDGGRAGAQARRRCEFVERRARPGTTASSGACTSSCPAEGTHPLRRQGHAPAPDHPHERQAARAGRQPAGAVLRHRGDGRGGDRGDRDHHRARRPATRSARPRATARRSASDHLHRAGRARGPGPRRADRRAVPRRRPVRHVPGRQPAAGRDRRPRRARSGPTSPTR